MKLLSRCRGEYSNGRLYDVEMRTLKAQKVRSMIYDFVGQELKEMMCVDIGCSIGVISAVLAENFGSVIGIDLDTPSIQWAQKNTLRSNVCFLIADGMQTPFPTEMFEVVICAQCYEHVSDARHLSDEVYRLLKPGGVCIFSGPNRLALVEEHYGLLFLSWLPRHLADAYIRLANRGHYYEVRPLTYWALKKLWKNFEIQDYTLSMLREPEKYRIKDEVKGVSWLGYLPDWFLRLLLVFAPNYNWILRKPL